MTLSHQAVGKTGESSGKKEGPSKLAGKEHYAWKFEWNQKLEQDTKKQ